MTNRSSLPRSARPPGPNGAHFWTGLAGATTTSAGASSNGYRYAGTCLMNCTTDNEVYSFHPGGSNTVFADGSVHFIKDSVNPTVFFALISRKAGEIVSSDQY